MARLYRFLIAFGMFSIACEQSVFCGGKKRRVNTEELRRTAQDENNQIEADLAAARADEAAELSGEVQLPIPGVGGQTLSDLLPRRKTQQEQSCRIKSPSEATDIMTEEEIAKIPKDTTCLVCQSEFSDSENGIANQILQFKCCKNPIHNDCFSQSLQEFYRGKTNPLCPLCKHSFNE